MANRSQPEFFWWNELKDNVVESFYTSRLTDLSSVMQITVFIGCSQNGADIADSRATLMTTTSKKELLYLQIL